MFSITGFTVSGIIVKFLTHFELIFVGGKDKGQIHHSARGYPEIKPFDLWNLLNSKKF